MAKKKLPETSLEARASLRPEEIRDMYRKIMVSLAALGQGTFEDISAHAKEPRERIWKRLSEMHDMGLIYRPGAKKVLKSGRQGYIWMLTGTALPKTEAENKALKGPSIADYSRDIQKLSVKQSELF